MTGRHGAPQREPDRGHQERAAGQERQNEYFLPGDGILREVIQADICRYLGNDALVRPGIYQGRNGYFIRGYRNLTTEMIADLKEDSRRWTSERQHLSERYPYAQVPSYLSSNIHEDRQASGPTTTPGPNNLQSMQPMQGGQPQYGGQQYGSTGGMPQQPQQYANQQQYGAQQYGTQQPQYSGQQDGYGGGQQYTHTSAPPNVTYAPSVSSYASYDSSYQQPRTTGTHTTSPYTDASNPYGGDQMDYQQQGGTYAPQTAGQPAYQGGTIPPQGYPTRDPVGYSQTQETRPGATNRHEPSGRDRHGDRRAGGRR